MKLGIVLPSFLYNDERKRLAADAFNSLIQTERLEHETRLLLLVKAGHAAEYNGPMEGLTKTFNVILKTDEGLDGTEQTLAFGTQYLLDNFGVDYITWMGDDALFNKMWLWHLEGLIKRHPDAKSWSVYRSAYEWVHKTLDDTGTDVLVRSICGHGMTFTKKEWEEWGIDWKKGKWFCHQGDTLDLVHSEVRAGERWVTKKSWVEHTGKQGVHCTVLTPEHAKDFQLVGEE
jgi:hypothetical protein